MAEHPLLRAGHTLLDIGVGLGWTSIHFARAGYAVTAFDPSLGPLQAAKAYAIEQGLQIEYLCAAMGYVDFRAAAFDNVAAFHSLHHVPDLRRRHRATSASGCGPTAGWPWTSMWPTAAWPARSAPSYTPGPPRTSSPAIAPSRTPTLAAPAHRGPLRPRGRGRGSGRAPAAWPSSTSRSSAAATSCSTTIPCSITSGKSKDPTAFLHALEIANQFQELVRRVDPDGGEYITVVAANRPPPAQEPAPVAPPAPLAPRLRRRRKPQPRARIPKWSALRARAADLEQALAAQGAWARSLEAAQQDRDRELARLRTHLRRVENGRVMRLLRRLRR